jgi:hypothetical protein
MAGSLEKTRGELQRMRTDHLRESFKGTHRNMFVTRTLEVMEIAKVMGDLQTARGLQAQAMAVVDDKRLRSVAW